MPASKQTYTGGLDKDTSKSKFRNQSYYDAKNIRVITDDGLSTGAIENEKGNKLSFQIPRTEAIWKIRRLDDNNDPASEVLTVNGTFIGYDVADNIRTIDDLLVYLESNATLAALVANGSLKIVQEGLYVYLIGLDASLTVSIAGTDALLKQVVSAEDNLKIIGWGQLREYIVIFTTSEDTKEPISSSGQIWVLKYDEFENTVEGLNGTFLVPSKHLIYNNLTKFSSYHRIEEPIGRYENVNTARIYWTDNNNPLRVINIFNPDNFAIPPDDLDIVANVELPIPKISSIGPGSTPVGSVVQYGYRLLNSNTGNETIISPLSRVLPLTNADPNTAEFNGNLFTSAATAYRGSSTANGAGARSVTWEVENLDQNYDVIEHFVILWTSVDNPQIFKFGEDAIPADGSITTTYEGSEDVLEVTLQEFNALNNAFIAKTLAAKDDRLVAANIKEKYFEIDFDARAYRSKEGQSTFDIFTKDGIGTTYDNTTWNTIPEDHDAINPFNQEDPDINPDWFTSDQYKYQPTNPTVLGGAGPNVSYTFTEKETTGNFNIDTPSTIQHVNVGRDITSDPDYSFGERYLDGTLITYPSNNQFTNFASPIVHALFQGYARGEVYRFGLVLYDKKGNPSFVRWIADIKMPEAYEDAPFSRAVSGTASNATVLCKNIGVQFNIDISSIQDQISAYSVVRVQREESDKTRLGTGSHTMYHSEAFDGEKSLYSKLSMIFSGPFDHHTGNLAEINDDNNQTMVHLMGKPGFTHFHGIAGGPGQADNKAVCNFHSPLGIFRNQNGYSFKGRDYIKTLGYYQTQAFATYTEASSRTALFYYKMATFLPIANANGTEAIPGAGTAKFPNGAQEHLIASEHEFFDGIAYKSSESPAAGVGGFDSFDYLVNAWGARKNNPSSKRVIGLGAYKQLLILNTDNTLSNWWERPSSMKYYGGSNHNQNQAVIFGTSAPSNQIGQDPNYFKVLSYNRFLRKQYGGNDYFSRSKSIYISTGHYQQVNELTDSSGIFFNVFGGDVFVNYFDDEYIAPYASKTAATGQPFPDPAGQANFGVALVYPCETSLNTELRAGVHWAADRDCTPAPGIAGGILNHNFDQRILLDVYDQENNAKQQFFAKDALLNTVGEHSHQARVSEAKIDGELIDNWRVFLPNNRLPVEGVHGQINKIINFRGDVYFYQDSAMGILSILERALATSETGIELVLGQGAVLDNYKYISTETGTIHQHSVVSSGNSLYHFDEIRKKIFRLSGEGMQPVSDLKGLSSFFPKLDGRFEANDLTLRRIEEGSTGVHAAFDPRHIRVLFTILEARKYVPIAPNTEYLAGSIILQDGIYYIANMDVVPLAIPVHPSSDPKWDAQVDKFGNNTFNNNLTISYNEYIQAFESFLDFTPRIYLNTNRRLLSENPKVDGDVYVHNEGTYGEFYEEKFPSKITLLINPEADITKVFDNIEYHSEVYINDIDQDQATLSSLRYYNEYQDTGVINLVVGNNVRRRMRRWRSTIPRDANKTRLRNPYIFLDITFSNSDDKRLVLHDIITHFRPTNM